MDRREKTVIEKRGLSVEVLSFIPKHYDRKDLVNIKLNIDKKSYKVSLLLDSYDHILFPEFRVIERYSSKPFSVISEWLKTVHAKIKYYIDSETYRINGENKTNSWDDCKEWWQEKTENNDIEMSINFWIKKNSEYLSQFDFSTLNEEGKLDELVSFLKERENYVKPRFNDIQNADSIYLNKMLNDAIKREDYEKAIEIREQIKQLK